MNQVNNFVTSSIELAAQKSFGQAILRLVDRTLWIIEKSVQWSLPEEDLTTGENGKVFGKVELVRPLPWIFFLPSLIVLRIIRFGIDMGTAILGYPRVQPSDMVRAIQRGRRRLRAVKMNGLKNLRSKKRIILKDVKERAVNIKEASKSLAHSIRLILSTLSCLDSGTKTSPSPPPTRIRVSNTTDATPQVVDDMTLRELLFPSPVKDNMKTDCKRKYTEISSDEYSSDEIEDEALMAKIERLVNESGSDKDFCPSDYNFLEESNSTESEMDASIPLSELQDIQTEEDDLEKGSCGNSECTITLRDIDIHEFIEIEKRSMKKRINYPELLAKASEKEDAEQSEIEGIEKINTAMNGISGDVDTIYYSPISWKSVSSETSISADKQDCQTDNEEKLEELSNGEKNNEKKDNDRDSNKQCVEISEEVVNGHMKEKEKTMFNNSNKQNQKNKRNNHGNRKKK